MNIEDMKSKAPLVAETFKVLGHPKRLMLLCLLRDELGVSDLVEATGLSQSQTSQYLNELERRGMLSSRSEGKQRFYQISEPKLEKLFESIYSIFCEPQENQS